MARPLAGGHLDGLLVGGEFEYLAPIRNDLERRGHYPLRFFLKCLEDIGAPSRTHLRKKHRLGIGKWSV